MSDEDAIEKVLRTLLKGFAERDAEVLRDVYVEDADWTNAFGRTLSGREAIVDYLKELFADPNFAQGEIVAEPEISVRPVGEDTVAVKTYTQVKGQGTVEGGTLPVRHNHSLKLLARQPDESWKVVSEIYMDARQEVTHVHPE
ncbi:YybH family protein [Chelativorans sp. YIM 93263]|uniref:YybH family protein n=1 Tax=Chelativorans sp. YIM 93263 TaxID=2906648 RepID=UPI002378A4A6|nr:SgcJ/EcaC family oxidoreductase [Chelativorans sp. YIM 93263]